MADQKLALEWASNGYHNHAHTDCAECNLAAAYLELRELAKASLDNSLGWEQEQAKKALHAALGEE